MGLVPEFVRAGSWVADPAFGCMWPWGVLAGTDLVLFVSSMAPGIFLTFRSCDPACGFCCTMSAPGSSGEAGVMGTPAPLLCQKCKQPTTMTLSCATGRNPLLRACNGCQATERWLTRAAAKPKCVEEETEDQRAKRMAALKVKEDLKKKHLKKKCNGIASKRPRGPWRTATRSGTSAQQLVW